MSEHQDQALHSYYDLHCAASWRDQGAQSLSPNEVVAQLWPLNAAFTPHAALIDTAKYNPAFEPAADDAVVQYILKSVPFSEQSLELPTWRVLKERHTQCLALAQHHVLLGTVELMSLPQTLPAHAMHGALVLVLLLDTTLPLPISDSPHAAQAPAHGGLTRH